LGHRAWTQVQPRHLGPYQGVVALVSDPAPLGAGLRVTFEIEGERFDAWLYGGARRKLEPRQAGDRVWVRGRRVALGSHARRAHVRHVVGRFEVEVTGDPSSLLTFHGWHPASIEAGLIRNPGIVATATHCVSAIPYVCAAEPGIKTYLDLPLIAGRAAPHLS